MGNYEFENEKRNNIELMSKDVSLKIIMTDFLIQTAKYKYTYNFTWLGRPIIQLPQDMIALQEIIWQVKPDLIIETGIAHGGSLIFSASLLELIGGEGQVVGVDIEIRQHNRIEIENHPMCKRITMIEGSSIDKPVVQKIHDMAKGKKRVMVLLDSSHTHDHVLKEMEAYSPLVTMGSYMVVFDTAVEDMPEVMYPDRPWGKGNNPRTAVWDFLKTNDRFEIDKDLESKLIITVAPDGYLKCVK